MRHPTQYRLGRAPTSLSGVRFSQRARRGDPLWLAELELCHCEGAAFYDIDKPPARLMKLEVEVPDFAFVELERPGSHKPDNERRTAPPCSCFDDGALALDRRIDSWLKAHVDDVERMRAEAERSKAYREIQKRWAVVGKRWP
jgi:hypothetical protein